MHAAEIMKHVVELFEEHLSTLSLVWYLRRCLLCRKISISHLGSPHLSLHFPYLVKSRTHRIASNKTNEQGTCQIGVHRMIMIFRGKTEQQNTNYTKDV